MTNTMNTPIEALEFAYPVQVTEYSIREGSGGKGRFSGGDGLVREIRLLSDAEVTVLSERRTNAPYGLAGGSPGQSGKNLLVKKGQTQGMPGKFSVRLRAGDLVRIETPGGGGYGRLLPSEE
jgi:N-methylhydantoinase B